VTYTFSAADFGFSDANDAPANSLLNVSLTVPPASVGTMRLGTVVQAPETEITVPAGSINTLSFTPAANLNGVAVATVPFKVQDNGGTANGGIDLDPTANTITINVTPVNDAPAGANATINGVLNGTLLEDGTYTFTTGDFGFTDPNDQQPPNSAPPSTLQSVRIASLLTNALTLGGAGVSVDQVISATAIAAGLLQFTPALNANGSSYASFTFQVKDNGLTANGGVDLDPTANTITINVTPVNDAPAGTNKTVNNAFEDLDYVFATTDFGFTDPIDMPASHAL
jgi:hypothetical protein